MASWPELLYSVRLRLTAWYVLVMAVSLAAFGGGMYVILLRDLEHRMDRSLLFTADALARLVEQEARSAFADTPPDAVVAEEAAELTFADRQIAVFRPDGTVLPPPADHPPASSWLPIRTVRELAIATRSGPAAKFVTIVSSDDEDFRVLIRRMTLVGRTYIVVVGRRTSDQTEFLEGLHAALLTGGPLFVLFAGMIGYRLLRKALHPVVTMSSEAAAISTADLTKRIAVHNPNDELGHLAITFNALLDRLTSVLEQQRRFMADASHELRTPLAIVRGEAEVALTRKDRPAAELRDSLQVIAQESGHLSTIIDDLFLLARADAGHSILARGSFYLDELIADAVHSLRSLAAKKSIEVASELRPESALDGDERLIRRMLIDVVGNALKYTPAGGRVSVSLQAAERIYEITVADTGPGVSAELRERIFERFFRGPASAAGDGAGLGLAIARTIAEVHGGTIELLRSSGTGSTFRIVLRRSTGEAGHKA